MKRRDFLQKAITASALPLFINGFPIQTLADNPIIQYLGKAGAEDRVLVLIQLNGGNDGLNTVSVQGSDLLSITARNLAHCKECHSIRC